MTSPSVPFGIHHQLLDAMPDPCQGGEELAGRHIAVCVPFYEWRDSTALQLIEEQLRPLVQLPARWREAAEDPDHTLSTDVPHEARSATLHRCASDLEQALALTSEVHP